MKVSVRKLFKDVDYLDKLSSDERDWLYRFELMQKYSMTPIDCAQNCVMARMTRNEREAYNRDCLNISPDKILEHYYARKTKPSYTWLDYPQVEDLIDTFFTKNSFKRRSPDDSVD